MILIFVDSHVHLYKRFNIDNFLDSAFNNFKYQAGKKGNSKDFIGVLCLADTSKSIKFKDLLSKAICPSENLNFNRWQFFRTKENVSLYAKSTDGKSLFIIAGQQIITKNKMEILAIGTDKVFQNGIPIKPLIKACIESDAIPILPWGFGKWTGQRKRIIEQLIEENIPLFFGDSSGRFVLKWCSLMQKIDRLSNKPILNGTDPLPLFNQDKKPGRFGFIINKSIDLTTPWIEIKKFLNDFDSSNIINYGKPDNFFRIILNQFLLRI